MKHFNLMQHFAIGATLIATGIAGYAAVGISKEKSESVKEQLQAKKTQEAGKALTREEMRAKGAEKMNLPVKGPRKEGSNVANPFGEEGVEYLLVGYSMFDFSQPEEDQNVFGAGGNYCSYPVYLKFNEEAGSFQIYNLVNLSSDIAQLPVSGEYNAETGAMSIYTNPWFESVDETGVIAHSGDDYIILQAGNPVGVGYWSDAEELVIESQGDGKVLTPASGFAAFGYQYDDYWEEFNSTGLYDVMFNTHLYKVEEGVNLLPSSYALNAGDCFVGESKTINFSLINAGTEETDYLVKVQGNGFSADVRTGTLGALESKEVKVTFAPDALGDYTGKITIQSEGEDIVVNLTGKGAEFPNFAQIVSAGADEMTFSTCMDYPWYISNDIIDAPVAVSNNVGLDNTSSSLTINISIAEGEKGVLKWSGFYDPFYGTRDEFVVTLDGDEVFYTPYQHQICDIDGSINLLAGDHEIVFSYNKDLAVFPQGVEFGNDRAWLKDLNLVVAPYQPQAASLANGDVDFNRFYLVGDYTEHSVDTPVIVNEGYENLTISEVRPSGIFSGAAKSKNLAPEAKTNVAVGFRASAPGEYEGDVVVVTSAGEFPIHCKVTIEECPDYSSIVSGGEFLFVPDNTYPFVVEDGKAYNCTSGVKDTEETLSILSALFNVPEGKYGKVTWDGETDTQANAWTADYGVLMVDNNQYGLHYYHGHDYAGYYSADPYEVYVNPGTHILSWGYFQCGDGKAFGSDRLTISNLRLELIDAIPALEVWQPTPIDMGDVFTGSFNIKTIHVANMTSGVMAFNSGDQFGEFKLEFDEEMDSEIPSMSTGSVDILYYPENPGNASADLTLRTSGGNIVIPVEGVGKDTSRMAFVEDFENGIGAWDVIDANDDKYRWQSDVVGYYARTGLGSVMIGTVFSDYTDDYLVSPEFTVPEDKPLLEYWTRYTKVDGNDYDILIGTGEDPTAYDVVYTDEGHSQFEFRKVSVDLSAYAGRKVRLAFHNRTNDGRQSVLIIDDLVVASESALSVRNISEGEVVSREYFDLQGIRLSARPSGLYVEKAILSDGSVIFIKHINK